MLTKMKLLAVSCVTMTACGNAYAATELPIQTITQSAMFGGPFGEGVVFGNQSTGEPISLFDQQLGSLKSITISGSFSYASQIISVNYGDTPLTGTVNTFGAGAYGASNASVNQVLNSVFNTVANGSGSSYLPYVAFEAFGPPVTITAPAKEIGAVIVPVGGNASPKSVVDVNPADLAAFTSKGLVSFLPTFSGAVGTSGDRVGGAGNAAFFTNLTFTYNYTAAVAAVPEPATWVMMLLGVGAIGFTMRRRQRISATSKFA